MRELRFHFIEPGMIEAIAHDPDSDETPVRSTGYGDHTGITDLMIDRDAETGRPYAWMCHNFQKSYAAAIWGLKVLMAEELFNSPQANLTTIPLHAAFSWAYYHFILEDGQLLPSHESVIQIDPDNITQVVLGHALQMAA